MEMLHGDDHPISKRVASSSRILGAMGPNLAQRIVQRVAATRPVAAVFRHTNHHVDRWCLESSAGGH
jgi:hypothetical protein